LRGGKLLRPAGGCCLTRRGTIHVVEQSQAAVSMCNQTCKKWLCVTATLTPSERLKGHVLQEQVMIWRNIQSIQITQEDIEAQFSNKL
jgi:riboflavin synthase alpha subunit